jgi:hypothetical protein
MRRASAGVSIRVGRPHAFCSRDALLERRGWHRVAREEEVAALAEPHVDLHLRRELAAHADALLHEAHVVLARPLRAHAAAVSPARAAAQVAAVDDGDVRHASRGEVVRDREAHDAGPHDDDVGVVAHEAGGIIAR